MDGKKRSASSGPIQITAALHELGRGRREIPAAVEEMLTGELRRIAAAWMRKERKAHTLCTTALVNEAYLRLFSRKKNHWNDRLHFLADASCVMRRVLVDYARRRLSREPGDRRVPIDHCPIAVDAITLQTLDVDRALDALAAMAPRQALLVELRYFGGCSLDEAAAAMEVSPRTADKDWLLARAWLKNYLDAHGKSQTGPA